MKKSVLLLIMASFVIFIPAVNAQDVDVSLYVLNLGKFDVATGAFTADFYLNMKCSEKCDVGNFEFMNGRASSVDKIIDTDKEKFYRIQGNFNSNVDLKKFPFDEQKMQIIIEDKLHAVDEIKYIAQDEQSGLDESIIFSGWNLEGWDSEVKEHEYKVYDETYSQYVFDINIARIKLNAFMKTFMPVFFILLVVLFSFVLDPDKITTRLGMAGSSLVASVMFHISISNQIPPVGYLTFADKFMVLTYAILLATFVINVYLLELLERKNNELVERIHRKTEYSMFAVVPLLYLILFLLF
ncbi:MAG TPA: hypothetical protein VJJ21_01265 [Candidatus Nanoarchaeia archaeon]|nr:hypothetical protein [Candidatus Nanoarchaeia archaeon]